MSRSWPPGSAYTQPYEN
uniref:Uncharacterized protein n=1 Tax=Arundo donax TaxID=35708 RepID=A0A0A9AYG3_ARUDO